MKKFVVAAVALLAAACGDDPKSAPAAEDAAATDAQISIVGVDEIAERFVKLALALSQYDAANLDAYVGPPEWAQEAKAGKRPLDELETEARDILEALEVLERDGADPRERGLTNLTTATLTRIRMAKGERFAFDEEARLTYGVTPPAYSLAEFDAVLADIDARLPGEGSLDERYKAFHDQFDIPADKLKPVLDASIAECRRRTRIHYDLPDGEKFTLRFVTDKPWGAYSWYQGDNESIIEINTDLPVPIERAVHLACHEGYPGHHVWNMKVDRDLRRAKGWVEYSIMLLFSPQQLIGEGSADYGVVLSFPGAEKLDFERRVLFPLAGLDPKDAARNDELNQLRRKLSHVRNYIAREYLDGRIDRAAAIAMLGKYELLTPEIAKRIVDFFDGYRAYVITYTIGQDLVGAYVDRKVAAGEDPWTAFAAILTSPDAVGALAAN